MSSSPKPNGTINIGVGSKKSYLTMKNFLKSLQDIQDECIGRVKKQDISQLPDKVAGASVHSVSNHISREEWNQMRENISQHSKDWRRFKNDPNKIVLEKNFFINCLNFMQAFFIFRPIDDDGKTYIKVNDSFFKSKPKDPQWRYLIPFTAMLTLVVLSFFAFLYINNYFLIGLIFLPASFILVNKKNKAREVEEDKWQKSFTNHPSKLLPSRIFSKLKNEFREKNNLESLVKISLDESPFFDDYRAMLNKTLEIARQTKGRIAWVWQFGPYTLLKDDFSITYHDFCGRILDQTLHVGINIKSSNIIPIIETERSFIFCLDNFSYEMEKYYSIPDGMIETLRSKTINSTKTVASDDLFRLNEI